jgi:hypothetical protein
MVTFDYSNINADIAQQALWMATKSSLTLFTAHMVCCSVVMYFDLTGQWEQYRLYRPVKASTTDNNGDDKASPTANSTAAVGKIKNYMEGYQNFLKDLVLLFLPFMTFCYYIRYEQITGTYTVSKLE